VTKAPHTLHDLHRVITMIAEDLDAFCKSNGITYYMMGGTALGAMRHNGFIPWDDDFDVFMDRENYLRFLTACRDQLDGSKYYLQREDTDEWPLFFSKFRLNDTVYEEREDATRDIHKGIYIDVMCLHNAFENALMRRVQYAAARMLSTFGLAQRGYHTTSRAKKLALACARVLNRAPIKWALLKFVRCLDHRPTRLVGHFFGRAPFPATSFARDLLGPQRYVPFEDTQLPVPHDVETYLATRFGPRYMEPPSDAVRASFPSHMVDFDLGPYAR